MKRYYIEICWHPSDESYLMQSKWYDTEEGAMDWASQIHWSSENVDFYLMSAEWDTEADTYGDIIQERLLDI